MKKIIAIALSVLMLITAASCGVSGGVSSAPMPGSGSAEQEIVDLNIISMLGGDEPLFYSSPVYEEFTKRSGVRLTVTRVDKAKFDLIVAGGDTTDIVVCSYADYYQTLASNGLILRLNDMIDKYGVNLKDPSKDVMFELLKYNFDNGDGSIYAVTNSIGMSGGNPRTPQFGTNILWSYFKEIGAPELNSFDDYIDAVEEIVKNNPKTPDGLPLYGFSFFNLSNNELYSFHGITHYLGFRLYNPNIYTRVQDNSLVYSYLDEDGPYWIGAKYMNDIYNRGLLDPDSFIQTSADHTTKIKNKQILTYYYGSGSDGYESIPISGGGYMYENMMDIGANMISIASTCKNPEAAFGLLDYLHGTDAARLVYSGIEGVHWNYDKDGVPMFTQEFMDIRNKGGDDMSATGVNHYTLYHILGVARGVTCADGTIADLARTKPFFVAGLSDAGKDYVKLYGERDGKTYEYPNQVMYGRGILDARDLNAPLTKSYGKAPDDIARLDASLLEIAVNAVPKLVMAAPNEYESVKASVMKEFNDAGVQTSYAYWKERWEQLADKFLK